MTTSPQSADKTTDSTSPPEKIQDSISAAAPSTPRFEPEKELFSWKVISRPFKRRSREYWVTVISIASLLAFILFLAEGAMPVILISSLIFLYYILSTVNPEEVEYKITNHGIKIADKVTTWDLLLNFWFTKRMDSDILVFETVTFPGRLELVVSEKDIQKIREILKKFVTQQEITPTYLDKAADWMVKKLPNN